MQHAGVIMGCERVADHAFRNKSNSYNGYFGLAQLERETSAVTGACLVFR